MARKLQGVLKVSAAQVGKYYWFWERKESFVDSQYAVFTKRGKDFFVYTGFSREWETSFTTELNLDKEAWWYAATYATNLQLLLYNVPK